MQEHLNGVEMGIRKVVGLIPDPVRCTQGNLGVRC